MWEIAGCHLDEDENLDLAKVEFSLKPLSDRSIAEFKFQKCGGTFSRLCLVNSILEYLSFGFACAFSYGIHQKFFW